MSPPSTRRSSASPSSRAATPRSRSRSIRTPGTLSLSSISGDQDLAQETIDVEAEGESGTIAFNYHYIFGCLNVLNREKEITLELKSYQAPGVFKSYDKINYLYLVMPVRILARRGRGDLCAHAHGAPLPQLRVVHARARPACDRARGTQRAGVRRILSRRCSF